MCTAIFIAAQFTIAKKKKHPKCPTKDDWIQKLWYISTMEYYSAIKKDEMLPITTPWMELETCMLSDVSQPEKDKTHMSSLTLETKEQNKGANKTEIDSGIQRKTLMFVR